MASRYGRNKRRRDRKLIQNLELVAKSAEESRDLARSLSDEVVAAADEIRAQRLLATVVPNPLRASIRIAMFGYGGALQTEGRLGQWTIVLPLAMDLLAFKSTTQRVNMRNWVGGGELI